MPGLTCNFHLSIIPNSRCPVQGLHPPLRPCLTPWIIAFVPPAGYSILAMKNRLSKNKFRGTGRRAILLIAAISLCLNTLLPALATAVDRDWTAVICTPDGYKTVRLDHDGVPLPAHRRHEGADCTICHGCAGHLALTRIAGTAAAPGTPSVIQPKKTSPYTSAEERGTEARGPPRLA